MDAGTSSNSPPPFLLKTFEMVDDPFTNSVVSWSHSGHSFVVWNPPEFAADLLPNYFKHNNFSSFIRQLNTYGFRKVDPDLWEFANDDFLRGCPHLLNNIHRRKPIHTHTHTPLPDSDRDDFEKKIAKLKHEKARLQSEADRHRDESCRYVDQLRSLANTLQNIDQRQQQLVIVLSKLLDKPEHAAKLALLPENKKRRVVEEESTTENLGTVSLEVVERLTSTCEELAANYNSPAWYGDCRKSSKSESQSSVEESPRGGGNDVFWQQFLSEAPSAKKMGEGWNSEDSDCTEEGTGTAWGWTDKLTRQLGDLNPPPF